MPYQEFLISNLKEGERKDLEPWLIPEDAFSTLENVFFRRGVLQKRYGYSYFGRMGVFVDDESIDTGDNSKSYSGTVSNTPVIPGSFSTSDDAGPQETFTDNGAGVLTGSATGTGTIDYTTGDWTLEYNANLAAGSAVIADYHYGTTGDDRNIRGIFNLENDNITDRLIAIDRDYLAVWNSTYKYFENQTKAGPSYDIFGNKNALMWGVAYKQKLWLCDGVDTSTGSGIWTYDPSVTPSVVLQEPQYGSTATHKVTHCRMIIPYYRRLVLLATRENDGAGNYTNYLQTLRWSKLDDPTSWRDDIPGEGGELPAATNEAIISAGLVNGTMVVAFERSIWIFEYTGDVNATFRWRKLAGSLEINSTFGRIVTENYIAFVGRGGIYACDGVSVKRIDEKIPDFTIDDIDLDNINLCHSVIDDDLDQSIFTFPTAPNTSANSRALVLGQDFGWFSRYSYGFNCFGKYAYAEDRTFGDLTDGTTLWGEYEGVTFKDLAHQSKGERVLSGKTKGYIYQVNDPAASQDNPEDVATSFNFTITSKRFNPYTEQGVKSRFGYFDLLVDKVEDCAFSVQLFQDQDSAEYAERTVTCSGRSKKVWKRVNVSNQANFHRFNITLSDSQLSDSTTSVMRPKIHAFKLAFEPSGSIRTE